MYFLVDATQYERSTTGEILAYCVVVVITLTLLVITWRITKNSSKTSRVFGVTASLVFGAACLTAVIVGVKQSHGDTYAQAMSKSLSRQGMQASLGEISEQILTRGGSVTVDSDAGRMNCHLSPTADGHGARSRLSIIRLSRMISGTVSVECVDVNATVERHHQNPVGVGHPNTAITRENTVRKFDDDRHQGLGIVGRHTQTTTGRTTSTSVSPPPVSSPPTRSAFNH